MTDTTLMTDNRRYERTHIVKLAFVRDGDEARGCLLQDISLAGALVEFIDIPGLPPHKFRIGEKVNFLVDEIGEASGHVVRTTPQSLAMAFVDMSAQEKQFIKSIEAAAD